MTYFQPQMDTDKHGSGDVNVYELILPDLCMGKFMIFVSGFVLICSIRVYPWLI